MDMRIRKLMTMHQIFNPRDDIDKSQDKTVSRKEGARAVTRIEGGAEASIQGLEKY